MAFYSSVVSIGLKETEGMRMMMSGNDEKCRISPFLDGKINVLGFFTYVKMMSIMKIHVSVKIRLVDLIHDVRKCNDASGIVIVFWIPICNVRVHHKRSYSQDGHKPYSSTD